MELSTTAIAARNMDFGTTSAAIRKMENDYKLEGWALCALVGGAALAVIPVGIVSAVSADEPSTTAWFIFYLVPYLIGFLAHLIVLKRPPANVVETRPLTATQWLAALLCCVPIIALGSLLGSGLSSLISGGTAVNPMENAFHSTGLRLVFSVLLAPLWEEFIFRKLMIDRCGAYGHRSAVIFSAVMFALYHGNLYQLFYAFGVGLVLGYVYSHTGRVAYTIALHMALNLWASIPSLLLNDSAAASLIAIRTGCIDTVTLVNSLPDLTGYINYLVVKAMLCVGGVVMLIRLHRMKGICWKDKELEMPPRQRINTIYHNAGVVVFITICCIECALALLI